MHRFAMIIGAWLLVTVGTAPAADDGGRFVVRPTTVERAALRELAQAFEREQTLPQIAQELNAMFVLPRDVGLRLVQCDESNAYYDADAAEIQLCLELIDGMAEVLQPQFESESEYTDALAGAFIATALHEAGHALVDVLQLPITGREEDAVDQLSAWLLIEAGESTAVLGAAAAYYTESETDLETLAGEHSLDQQRYFNHLCWVYGSAPNAHGFLIEEWELPEARADLCEDEYKLLDRAWTRLLDPHLRRPAGADRIADLPRNGFGGPVPTGRVPTIPAPTGRSDDDDDDDVEQTVISSADGGASGDYSATATLREESRPSSGSAPAGASATWKPPRGDD